MKKTRDQINRELVKKAQNGDISSRDTLLDINLGLIYSMAKKILRTYKDRNNLEEDLIQEGRIALIKSIYNYDFRKDTKFSYYASRSIRESLISYKLLSNRAIPITHNMSQINYYINQINREDPNLSNKEIAKKIKSRLNIGISDSRISYIKRLYNNRCCSLDYILKDAITYKQNDDYTESKDLMIDINELIPDILTQREQEILEKRFGFNGYKPHTLNKIGNIYGLTKERVRQIEKKIINKLIYNLNPESIP